MIGRLTGRVVEQEFDGLLVLDVGGVGYELATPLGTLGRSRSDETGRVTLWVHTHVREDALSLFGFSSDAERTAFRALLGVTNVGPKIAIAVLGLLPSADLARAIATRNLAALTAVTGVGKKLAERLLLEMRDKLPVVSATSESTNGAGVPVAPELDGNDGRLRAALLGMGFRPAEVERAIQSLPKDASDVALGVRIRDALALLAK